MYLQLIEKEWDLFFLIQLCICFYVDIYLEAHS